MNMSLSFLRVHMFPELVTCLTQIHCLPFDSNGREILAHSTGKLDWISNFNPANLIALPQIHPSETYIINLFGGHTSRRVVKRGRDSSTYNNALVPIFANSSDNLFNVSPDPLTVMKAFQLPPIPGDSHIDFVPIRLHRW
jgi:hypothetical protein